jgi:Stage II sporulation protein E (SpoIIE)
MAYRGSHIAIRTRGTNSGQISRPGGTVCRIAERRGIGEAVNMAGSGEHRSSPGSIAVLPEPDVLRMLDQVAEFVMLARPVRDDTGRVTGFRVDHLSPALLADEASRQAAAGLFATGGLSGVAASVLASGQAVFVPGLADGLLGIANAADLRAAPLLDGVVVTWRAAHGKSGHPWLAGPGVAAPGTGADADGELATRLQRSVTLPDLILDPRLGKEAGLDIAVRYRPAGTDRVAGDWYDVMPMPGGDLLVVVGDIAGHGVSAVTAMVGARKALRGLADTGASPAELLRQLNYGACHLTDGTTGTVVCGRYNPARRELRWARAGHLPPVLVRDGAATPLPLPEGMLLGVDPAAEYAEVPLALRPDDTLLLYTDGLIERRATSISDAVADLAATALAVGPDAEAHASRIVAGAASDTGDDACLVVIRVL